MIYKPLNILKMILISILVLSCSKTQENKLINIEKTTTRNFQENILEEQITKEDENLNTAIENNNLIKNTPLEVEQETVSQQTLVQKLEESKIISSKDNNIQPIIEKHKLDKIEKSLKDIKISEERSSFKLKNLEETENVIEIDKEINNIQKNDKKAVNAALEMLSKKAQINNNRDTKNTQNLFIKKQENNEKFTIAVLTPLSGERERIGKEIAMGIENAYFSTQKNNVNIRFFDTMNTLDEFFDLIEKQKIDLILGPVFSDKIVEIYKKTEDIKIPILSFSNNINHIYKNVWLFGKIQEDEIEEIANFGIKAGIRKFAILGENSQYSKVLVNTAERSLNKVGIKKETIVFDRETLDDRNKLRQKIKNFSGWKKEDNDKLILPKPKYDGILFAGPKEFILKIAPLLSYYDLDALRVTYLGNSQFNDYQLINELSLQGSFFSSSEEIRKLDFIERWKNVWGSNPSFFSQLGNDLGELAIKISFEQNPIEFITRKEGHNWVTGKIYINEEGLNKRSQVINKIENKKLRRIYME